MKYKFTLPLLATLISIVLLSSCNTEKKPKYIFYFIGDGFGLSQSILAENYFDAINKDTSTVHLEFMKMPVLGIQSTYSANRLVTCSSASGTALATGTKTNNGMLGVNPNGEELNTIAEKFHKDGYNVGIISNVGLDHATPGAFYASAEKRSYYNEIAKQLAESNFEFFGGGGLNAAKKNPEIWDYVKEKGYTVTNNKESIDQHQLSDGKLFATSSIVGGSADIPYYVDQPNHDMHLSYFVQKMIDLFKDSDKGFFSMIESGKIDWAGHGNDPVANIFEVKELDEAYKVAYQFYLEHPDETLIIITADHETGGLTIGQRTQSYNQFPEIFELAKGSAGQLTAKIDKLVEKKAKVSEAYKVIEEFYGFNGENKLLALNNTDSVRIELIYGRQVLKNEKYKQDKIDAYNLSHKINLSDLCLIMINEKSGTGWTTGGHTGITVPVRAIGAGAENFSGFYDNTDIPKKLNAFTKTPNEKLN